MRGEADGYRLSCRAGQLLLYLRRMSVGGHSVSLNVLIDLTVQTVHLASPACAGCAGLGINDDGIRVNEPFLYQRIRGQKGAGGETSRIGNEPGPLHLFPVDFGQPVHGFTDEPGGCMGQLIPFLINRHILNTEISA